MICLRADEHGILYFEPNKDRYTGYCGRCKTDFLIKVEDLLEIANQSDSKFDFRVNAIGHRIFVATSIGGVDVNIDTFLNADITEHFWGSYSAITGMR